jgi:hypothetical protein
VKNCRQWLPDDPLQQRSPPIDRYKRFATTCARFFLLGRSKGWRATKDLCVHVLSKCDKEQLFVRDLLELRDLLSAKDHNNHSICDAKSGKHEKRRAKHDPLMMLYLAYSWGFGKNHTQRVLASIEKEGKQLHSLY